MAAEEENLGNRSKDRSFDRVRRRSIEELGLETWRMNGCNKTLNLQAEVLEGDRDGKRRIRVG